MTFTLFYKRQCFLRSLILSLEILAIFIIYLIFIILPYIFFNSHGLVGHRVRDNTNDFKNPLVVAFYSVDYTKNTKGKNELFKNFLFLFFKNLLLFLFRLQISEYINKFKSN